MNDMITERVPTSDGISLAADIYPARDTTRPTVLLLHGGGQNRHAWAHTARRLQAHGHTVVAFDTRGHGDSDWDPTGDYDMQRLAADLLTIRDVYAPERPPVAVGASMGGMTILTTHLLAPPDLWSGVILVDVTPRMDINGAQRVVGFMAAHPDGFPTLTAAADVIAAYNPHRARPESTDGLHKVLRQRPDGRWVWRWDPAFVTSKMDSLRTDPERFDVIAELLTEGATHITAPTLLVRGAQSDLVSPEAVSHFLTAVPHADAVDVSGTGHMVAGDDNDAFTSAVLNFLRSLPSSRKPE
jgi:pimeloyl-ACP methyl ester carboxylesterase